MTLIVNTRRPLCTQKTLCLFLSSDSYTAQSILCSILAGVIWTPNLSIKATLRSVSNGRFRGSVSSRYCHIRALQSFDMDKVYLRKVIFLSGQLAVYPEIQSDQWFPRGVGSLASHCWSGAYQRNPFSPRSQRPGFAPPWDLIPGTTSKQTPPGTAAVSVADGECMNAWSM